MAKRVQVVFDCHDPAALSRFWAQALGYELEPPPPGFASWQDWLRAQKVPEDQWNSASACVDPEGVGPRLYFQRVPEGKVVKNRVHLDIIAGGPKGTAPEERRAKVNAGAERLVGLGAKRLQAREERGAYWVNMLDPEENEFDVE
ncbi:MAG: VOC family protein [Chloroflexi bacterium]|nr:VOC family protein [Chloroflexota bacterium]